MDQLLWSLNVLGVVFIAVGFVVDIVSSLCKIYFAIWGQGPKGVPFVAPALYVLGCFLAQAWLSPVASMIGMGLIVFHVTVTFLLPKLVHFIRTMGM